MRNILSRRIPATYRLAEPLVKASLACIAAILCAIQPGLAAGTYVPSPVDEHRPKAQESTSAPGSYRTTASLAESGAVGDGRSDDTAAINAFLARSTKGGLIRLPPGKFYLINSGDLVVPTNVRLEGASSPLSSPAADPREASGGFLLNPNHTIRMLAGSQLENVAILRPGLLAQPSAEQVKAAVAEWGEERSVAVTLPRNLANQTLRNLFIEGFNTCIKSSVGGFVVQRVHGDCYNGLEVTAGGDNYYVDNVRFEPYYALRKTQAASGAWNRPGIAFNLHDGNTGSILTRVFSFMWANGLVFNDTGVAQLTNSGFEWRPEFGNGTTGSVGVRWINHNADTSADNVYVNGFDTAFSDEGWGEVLIRAASVGQVHVAAFNLGGGNSQATTITISGTPTASPARLEATVQGAGLHGGLPLTVGVSVPPGGNGTAVAMELAQRIDAAQPLIAAGVSAGVRGNVVTLYGPPRTELRVGARASAGLAVSVAVTKGAPGSYGAIIAPNVNAMPAFLVGAGIVHWNIVDPYLGNGNLPRNWLVADPAAIERISLSGIPWSRIVGPANLSACGTDPRLAPGASDARGSLTEGIGATGCILTFATPYVVPPTCVVSSTNGAALAGYSATATQLRIGNAARQEARFSYVCLP